MVRISHWATGDGPNIAALLANGQIFPKVQTLPTLYKMDGLVTTYLKNGVAIDMKVVGSLISPQVFEFVIPTQYFFALAEVNLIIADAAITPVKFGGLAGTGLANGLIWQILDQNNVLKYDFAANGNIKQNFEFNAISGATIALTGGSDQLSVTWRSISLGILGGLDPGWKVRMIVRDDLTGLDAFRASITGAFLPPDVVYAY